MDATTTAKMASVNVLPGIEVCHGYHKERGSFAKILRIYTYNPDDKKMHFLGYEIREWSQQTRKWYGAGFSANRAEIIRKFEKYYCVSQWLEPKEQQ